MLSFRLLIPSIRANRHTIGIAFITVLRLERPLPAIDSVCEPVGVLFFCGPYEGVPQRSLLNLYFKQSLPLRGSAFAGLRPLFPYSCEARPKRMTFPGISAYLG